MSRLKITENELKISFSRSAGPGGQNVNKVSTKATIKWDFKGSSRLSNEAKARFAKQYKSYVHQDGLATLSSQKYRTQQRNLADCIKRLNQMVVSILKPPKVRKKTKPTRSSVEKRLSEKKQNSEKKKMRQAP